MYKESCIDNLFFSKKECIVKFMIVYWKVKVGLELFFAKKFFLFWYDEVVDLVEYFMYVLFFNV
jgi:hypothetical protein